VRVTCLLLSLLIFNTHAKVEFKISPVHGLVKFAELLSENNKDYWSLISNKEKESIRSIVDNFSLLKNKKLSNGFDTGEENYKGRSGGNTWSLILWQSILSKDLKDFDKRITGLATIHNQIKLMKLLTSLKPYFDLFWESNKSYLKNFSRKAANILNRSDRVSSLLRSIRIFYGSTWPQDRAFPIGLFLLPRTAKVTTASSYDSFEEASIVPGEKIHGRLGVMIHEMCHSYYANQKNDLFIKMKNFYSSHKSKFSHHAYNYMNESLATVLGNGIAYQVMKGKLDKRSWYNDEIIDGFSHALLPITQNYIKENKTMDEHYFDRSIDLFQNTFPNMNKKIRSLLNKPLFSIVGTTDPHKVKLPLFDKLNLQGFRFSSPFTHRFTREAFDMSKSPLIVIVDRWDSKTRNEIMNMYSEIYKNISSIMNGDSDWGYFFNKDRFILIIKYKEQKDYLAVIDDINRKKEID